MDDRTTVALSVAGLGRSFALHGSERTRACHALWMALAPLPLFSRLAARRGQTLGSTVWALRDVSFAVRRGESVGIVGANGSGKSTLLHVLCGTVPPTTGAVTTHGRIAALLELGTGFVPDLSGRANARLSGLLHGLDQKTVANRTEAISDFADIGAYFDQPVRTYSSGMYVRLAFAVMAHLDAEILVVDEALAVGDIRFVQKCLAHLDRFRAAGGTLVFVSHDLAAVRRLCTRTLWLDAGHLRLDGEPREVTEAYFDAMIGTAGRGGSLTFPVGPPENAVGVSRPHVREEDRPPALAAREVYTSRHPNTCRSSDARIVDVQLLDARGAAVTTVGGGERVQLHVVAEGTDNLSQPILGFYVKDRLGQHLFGENTLAARASATGRSLRATFVFTMPRLFPGDYLVAVALAEGSQAAHVHHEWRHAAWQFTSVWPGSATGLVGIDVEVIWHGDAGVVSSHTTS